MRYLWLLLCFIGFGLVAFQTFTPPKIVKVALLIENTDFQNWISLGLKKSANTVQGLLLQQDFAKNNIWIARNITTKQCRDTIDAFIKRVKKLRADGYQVIVVTYYLSHGTRIEDLSLDEGDMKIGDKEDEVFVCKDTPAANDLAKEHKIIPRTNGSKQEQSDYHPNAIIDDEMGQYNEQLVEAIGTGGQYISWADYCESQGGAKGNNSPQPDAINLIDGGDFMDFIEKPENQSLSRPSAVLMAATNVEIRTALNGESYFVQALKAAFQAPYLFGTPTLQSIYDDFKNELLKLEQNKGIFILKEGQAATHALVPPLHQFTPNSDDKPIFLGAFKAVTWSLSTVIKKALGMDIKGPSDSQELTFALDSSVIYTPYTYLQIREKESKQVLTEGLLTKVNDKNGTALFPTNVALNSEKNYTIQPNLRPYQKAAEALQRAQTKMELREVMKELHSPLLGVTVTKQINAYKRENTITTRKVIGKNIEDTTYTIRFIPTSNGKNFKQDTTVTTRDNITLKISLPSSDSSGLYYTVIDVTDTNGLQACYTDTLGKDKGFSLKHNIPLERVVKNGEIISLKKFEEHHYRSSFTPPLQTPSYLWVLVSDTPIDDEIFRNVLLGNMTIKDDAHRAKLWQILKHIRYFEELSYIVLPNR